MKAVKMYSGHDSVGRLIEVAKGVDGSWFHREYGWNGYGNTWSRWAALDSEPEFPSKIMSRVECADSPEYIQIPEQERELRISWGFQTLTIVPGTPRVRLPN
jgi:hypothetical protein